MAATAAICALEHLGLLRFRGPDTLNFLQGQLSNDVQALRTATSVLAGFHSPQGRVLAILRLQLIAADDVIALLPAELTEAVSSALRRYVLRAKLVISDDTPSVRVYGYVGNTPPSGMNLHSMRMDTQSRWLLAAFGPLSPELRFLLAVQGLSPAAWHALDIAAGLPQVYRATSGQFVAQMLNLDCVGAISFTKGCYTGQEVIARAHYRGRVKRRLQRFITRDAAILAPGDSGVFEDGRNFRVVDATINAEQRCEFLAVAATDAATAQTEDAAQSAASAPSAMAASAALVCVPLPLPYRLPD